VSENKEASAEEKNPESKKSINIINISKLNSKSPFASIVSLQVVIYQIEVKKDIPFLDHHHILPDEESSFKTRSFYLTKNIFSVI
jgi:hypothetical protein